MKYELIIITGPTAVGKSSVAVELALKIGGEIISADSMQIYKRLNIGTGKIKKEEQQGIPHFLIDICEPDERYTVSQFVVEAQSHIEKILARGKIPILVGGTGLYIDAVINGHNFAGTGSTEWRQKYERIAEEKGNAEIYGMLQKIDPESCEKISINDTKRIVRALEIYEQTGIPKSKAQTKSKCKHHYKLFVLNLPRETLYNQINTRVESMFKEGLLDEVRGLMNYFSCQSMQAIGYKEVANTLLNNGNVELTKAQVQINSRHYAKRQITYFKWFKADKTWLENDYLSQILKEL